MSRAERDKGRKGEREVANIYEALGFEVRGLEASGDHLIVCSPASGIVLHSEVKRQETARPWAWFAQAAAEAPPGAIPAVHFRRNKSPWLALLPAVQLATILARLRSLEEQLAAADRRWVELE